MPVISSCLAFCAVFILAYTLKPAWDTLSTTFVADQLRRAQALAIDSRRVQAYLRLWGSLLVLDLVLIGVVGQMPLLAFALAGLLLLAPRWLFESSIRRRKELMRDQMVGCTVALCNAARAGQSLVQGLQSVCQESPDPLSSELKRIVAEYELGRPLSEALNDAKQRLQLDSFSMFSSAIIVSLQRGGRITNSLERISRSLQENQRIERKLTAETASGWRVVLILTIFPFLFLAGFYVLYPEGTSLMFRSLVGQFLLMCILALVAVSVWWSRKILSIEL